VVDYQSDVSEVIGMKNILKNTIEGVQTETNPPHLKEAASLSIKAENKKPAAGCSDNAGHGVTSSASESTFGPDTDVGYVMFLFVTLIEASLFSCQQSGGR
jgi:hypothetical protein